MSVSAEFSTQTTTKAASIEDQAPMAAPWSQDTKKNIQQKSAEKQAPDDKVKAKIESQINTIIDKDMAPSDSIS